MRVGVRYCYAGVKPSRGKVVYIETVETQNGNTILPSSGLRDALTTRGVDLNRFEAHVHSLV